jgi:multidrug efflux pump subunit AcrB
MWAAPFVWIQGVFEMGFEGVRRFYVSVLGAVLRYRAVSLPVMLAGIAVSLALVPGLGRDFFPAVDSGQFRLHFRAPTGLRLEEAVMIAEKVERLIREEIPANELVGILDNTGIPTSGISLSYSNNGLIGTGDGDVLVSLSREHRPTEEYVRRLRLRLGVEFPGVMFYFLPADIVSQTLNFGLPAPFDIQIRGRNTEENRALAVEMLREIRAVRGAVDVRIQQPMDLPRLKLDVDRDRAALMGVTERDVAGAVLLGLSGSAQVQPVFWLNPKMGVQYLVNFRAPEHQLDSVRALETMPVAAAKAGAGDGQILSNVAAISRTQGIPVVSHYNILPVINIYGAVSGRDLGGVMSDIYPIIDRYRSKLPRGSFIEVRGQVETMRTGYQGLGYGLLGAVVLIYLLLVVNFQSWRDPFIILMALPGALAGVAWGLFLTRTPLSVPALMGAIMSLGVATANSVLMVSFAREEMQRGADGIAAMLSAGSTRLRAVIMTAIAMVVGMVPMSLGFGEGGEQNAPLARAVIGGLTLATVATLFFVPLIFTLLRRSAPSVELELEDTAPVEKGQV